MKKGFTLIELLVASLLMGMLVTILTMVFNSSSIAWRTGKAGIAEMSGMRRQLSAAAKVADNMIPFVSAGQSEDVGLIVSPWVMSSSKSGSSADTLRKRGFIRSGVGTSVNGEMNVFNNWQNTFNALGKLPDDSSRVPWGFYDVMSDSKVSSQKGFVVGVRSWGPDRKEDTADDITSWPEDAK